VKRGGHGRIARDPHAKEAFRKSHPCPSTGKTYGACPGWVVDHVRALKHGGADDPSNMQWQTRAAAKDKDKWEWGSPSSLPCPFCWMCRLPSPRLWPSAEVQRGHGPQPLEIARLAAR
jgi:hypothetical protein